MRFEHIMTPTVSPVIHRTSVEIVGLYTLVGIGQSELCVPLVFDDVGGSFSMFPIRLTSNPSFVCL